MDRRLLIAVWAISGLTTLVFAGYYASVALSMARGGPGLQPFLLIGGVLLLVALLVLGLVGLSGQVRITRLRSGHPGSTIVPVRFRRGLDGFADRYALDTGRAFGGADARYAAFGGGLLTLLTSDGRELLSFDIAHAVLTVEPAAGSPAVVVAVAGYPRLALGFPRAWSAGLLQRSAEELRELVAVAGR
jgi:hypothetical protein